MGTLDRAVAPFPDAKGKKTMPYHTQLSAPAPITTGPEFNSPSYKSVAISGAGRAARISTCSPHFRM